MQGHMEKHQDQSGGRRREGRWWARDFIVLSMERKGRGRVSRFRLANLKTFSELWYGESIPSCLV